MSAIDERVSALLELRARLDEDDWWMDGDSEYAGKFVGAAIDAMPDIATALYAARHEAEAYRATIAMLTEALRCERVRTAELSRELEAVTKVALGIESKCAGCGTSVDAAFCGYCAGDE